MRVAGAEIQLACTHDCTVPLLALSSGTRLRILRISLRGSLSRMRPVVRPSDLWRHRPRRMRESAAQGFRPRELLRATSDEQQVNCPCSTVLLQLL